MSRRRYLSTEISIDTAVNRLARSAGDFAVMLYTWMIPHCDDDGIVHGDAEEIILQVIPGRRDKKIEDVTTALTAMQEHGLIEWDQDERCVRFPAASFYKYQTYIKPERRRGATGAENNNAPEVTQDADNSANQRKTPQNTVSVKHSLSHPVTHSHSEKEPPVSLRSTSPRGARIPATWPTDVQHEKMVAFGEEQGIAFDAIVGHINEYHDYWSQATKNATSLDWVKRWRVKFAEDIRVGRVGGSRSPPSGNGKIARNLTNLQEEAASDGIDFDGIFQSNGHADAGVPGRTIEGAGRALPERTR
jgi:hypothetical protein